MSSGSERYVELNRAGHFAIILAQRGPAFEVPTEIWDAYLRQAALVAALTFLRQGEDISVKSDWQPHPSHQMKEWRSTILNFGGSDRFGSIRSCSECGAEEAKGGQSHRADTSLTVECGYDPFAVLAEVRQASGQEVSRE